LVKGIANARRRTSASFITGLLWSRSSTLRSGLLFGIVPANVEGAHALAPVRKLHHLGLRERAHRVVVAALPMLFHGSPREFEVLVNAFVAPGAIDQVDDVAHFLVGFPFQELCILAVAELLRNPFQHIRKCATQPL